MVTGTSLSTPKPVWERPATVSGRRPSVCHLHRRLAPAVSATQGSTVPAGIDGWLHPESLTGRRLILHFGAVDYEATIWANGVPVAHHRGGYSPFSADLTARATRSRLWSRARPTIHTIWPSLAADQAQLHHIPSGIRGLPGSGGRFWLEEIAGNAHQYSTVDPDPRALGARSGGARHRQVPRRPASAGHAGKMG